MDAVAGIARKLTAIDDKAAPTADCSVRRVDGGEPCWVVRNVQAVVESSKGRNVQRRIISAMGETSHVRNVQWAKRPDTTGRMNACYRCAGH